MIIELAYSKLCKLSLQVPILLEINNIHLIQKTMKNLDFKSLLIGFLLASVAWLAMGNRSSTLDVRIVGVKKNFTDWDELKVELSK